MCNVTWRTGRYPSGVSVNKPSLHQPFYVKMKPRRQNKVFTLYISANHWIRQTSTCHTHDINTCLHHMTCVSWVKCQQEEEEEEEEEEGGAVIAKWDSCQSIDHRRWCVIWVRTCQDIVQRWLWLHNQVFLSQSRILFSSYQSGWPDYKHSDVTTCHKVSTYLWFLQKCTFIIHWFGWEKILTIYLQITLNVSDHSEQSRRTFSSSHKRCLHTLIISFLIFFHWTPVEIRFYNSFKFAARRRQVTHKTVTKN